MFDCYIVGAQKAGTSSLHNWLSQHPSICSPVLLKDCGYYSSEKVYNEFPSLLNQLTSKCKDDKLILGAEASASFNKYGFNRLIQDNKNVKIIYIVRNPIKRALSAYHYAVERGLELRSFDLAIKDELTGYSYDEDMSLEMDYILHSSYKLEISRIQSKVKKNNLLVIQFEEMILNSHRVMKEICNFLNIPMFDFNYSKINQTRSGSRFMFLSQLLYGDKKLNKLRTVAKNIMPYSMRKKFRLWLLDINRSNKLKSLNAESFQTKYNNDIFKEDILFLKNRFSIDYE